MQFLKEHSFPIIRFSLQYMWIFKIKLMIVCDRVMHKCRFFWIVFNDRIFVFSNSSIEVNWRANITFVVTPHTIKSIDHFRCTFFRNRIFKFRVKSANIVAIFKCKRYVVTFISDCFSYYFEIRGTNGNENLLTSMVVCWLIVVAPFDVFERR